MRNFIKIVLLIVEKVSAVISMIYGFFAIYDLLTSPADTEKLLKWIHFPLSYNEIFYVGIVSTAIMIITYFVRIKLFRK